MRAINRFHRVFILICFPLQNSFRSGHNSKKQSHIFYFLIDFRSSRSLISFRSRRTFFKKHWNVCRSSHTIFNIKKIYSEAAAHFLSEAVFQWYLFRSSRTFLKKTLKCLWKQLYDLQHKKYQLHGFCTKYAKTAAHFTFKNSCTIFTVSSQNVLKIFS